MGAFDNQTIGGKKKAPPGSGIAAPTVATPTALPAPEQPAVQVAAPGIAAGADGFMRTHQAGDATSISYPPVVPNMTTQQAPVPAMPIPAGIQKNMAQNPNPDTPYATIADVPRPTNQVQVAAGGQPVVKPAPAATVQAAPQTVDDGYGGIYTPGGGAIAPDKAGSGILNGIANFFGDSAQAARTGVHYDDVKANRLAAGEAAANPGQASPQPANATAANPANFKQDQFGASPDVMGVKPSVDGQMMTGRAQYDASGLNKTGVATPDSSSGGFTAKDGTSYNVNQSKQEGIAKITATSKNPLYTNIKPEDAVAGLKNQMIGGSAADVQEGLDRHARANAVWQSVIDKQPQGGIAILGDGGIAADNAEKTARWRQDDLLAQAKGGNRAAGEVAQETARGQNQMAAEAIRGGTQMATEQGRNAVAMRGQDMTAQNEANRLSIDAPYRLAQAAGQEQHNRSTSAIADLQQRAIAGDSKAIETLRALNGKTNQATDRFMAVQGGEEIGPDGMTKIKRPGGVFDAQTGRFVEMNPQQGGPGKFSKADVESALAKGADKAKIAERIKSMGGNPADYGL